MQREYGKVRLTEDVDKLDQEAQVRSYGLPQCVPRETSEEATGAQMAKGDLSTLYE